MYSTLIAENLSSINNVLMRAGKKNVTLDDIRQNLNSPQPVTSLKVEGHLPSIRPKSSLRPSKIGEQLLQKSNMYSF